MAEAKLYCYYCSIVIIALLCAKSSTGVEISLQKQHRSLREVQPLKEEKSEPTEAASTAPPLRPRIEGSARECIRFNYTYCNSQFGYEYGLFPNHRGQTAKEAAEELNHFAQLFYSGCSDKIGVFLCFSYFPLCVPNMGGTEVSSGVQLEEVLPCKETCEEVHKSECTEYVLNVTGGWAEHLSCNQSIFKPEASKQCASGEPGTNGNEESNEDNENEICQSKPNSSRHDIVLCMH